MGLSLRTLQVAFVPLFVAYLFTSSAAFAQDYSQNEKLIWINNITTKTRWIYIGERDLKGRTVFRFNSAEKDSVYLLVTDLRSLSEEVSKNDRAVPGGYAFINPKDHQDYHFPAVEQKAAIAIETHLGTAAQLKSLTVRETGHTVAIYEMADHTQVSVIEPSKIFSRVMKYGAFLALGEGVIFPSEQAEKLSSLLKLKVKKVEVTVNGLLQVSTSAGSVIVNRPEDFKNPQILEQAYEVLRGSLKVDEQVALKRIQQNRDGGGYLGVYLTDNDATHLFQNILGEVHVSSSPLAYLESIKKGGPTIRLCRDLVRK